MQVRKRNTTEEPTFTVVYSAIRDQVAIAAHKQGLALYTTPCYYFAEGELKQVEIDCGVDLTPDFEYLGEF